MTLPDNYNPWEHLQSVLMKTFNREVRKEYSDTNDDDGISTPRSSLKQACLIDDNDTATMILIRLFLFNFVVRKASDMQAPIYGMPVGSFHQERKFRPQIMLYFKEDREDVDPDFYPLDAHISFRLMDETDTSMTKAKLTTIANKIKSEFGMNNGYRFHKGKTVCSYYDNENGYQFKIFCFNKAEGKEVIRKVLDINNKTPDWKFLSVSENEEPTSAFPTIPPSRSILGKSTREPRRRAVGYVRFRRAYCQIWASSKPVDLVDLTGKYWNALANS
jgi:hypothetical protein